MTENFDAGEVMTLVEVADYLQLAERTVLKMAQRGEIPAAKVASQWRFLRPLVREWLVAQVQSFPGIHTEDAAGDDHSLLPLTEVLRPELMVFDITPGPKESVLRQLLVPLMSTGFASDVNRLLGSLLERERLMTTAVGHGVSIPHPRKPLGNMFKEPAIVLGLCPSGTQFDAVDDQFVHIFFLICATRIEIHLQMMAKVAWLAGHDALSKLRQARNPEDVLAIVTQATRELVN